MTRTLLQSVLLLLFLFAAPELMAQKRAKRLADEDTKNWRYEIQCVNVGRQGSYLIKVYSFSRKKHIPAEQSKKNAVHGIIFKGIPAGERGCVSQPPLARNANVEQEKREYFDDFFAEGGKYMKFVSLTTDGAVAATDRFRVGRNGKEYKIGVVVTVNIDLLRKELESAGIIRGLSSGF
ncbi:hypothetical protein [Sinomicrobium soli]|uniref:hypothetical protein n=1 Tax=Sinomicrobium sp. N-1-3-6 TaxID=2219864 RepID=UPI000DCEBFF3|nr:hypothetical protein [Sinomicrobium sp. N-1-3-6]RAV30191.1 hypothetical protein DN748_05200 [Sinomicrobium sp. N-1-3-6]